MVTIYTYKETKNVESSIEHLPNVACELMLISWYVDPCLTLTRIVGGGGGAELRSEPAFRFWTSIPPGLTSHSSPDSPTLLALPPAELPFMVDSPVVLPFVLIIFLHTQLENFQGETLNWTGGSDLKL